MSEFEHEYPNVVFLAVNAYEPIEKAQAFAATAGLPLTYLRAESAALASMGVDAVPTQILIDPQGQVVWTSGLLSVSGGPDALRKAIDEAIAR